MLMALALLDADRPRPATPAFDLPGFLLLASGLACLLGALEWGAIAPGRTVAAAALAAAGLSALTGYVRHSRRTAAPLIDLRILDQATFFVSAVGALPLRMAIGAVPVLLPLLFQLGFGLSPLDSGVLAMGTAVGSLATRAVLGPAIDRIGFRPLLMGATVCTSGTYLLYAGFSAHTPHLLLFAAMIAGGLVISMVMVSLQTLAYADIAESLMGQATALATMVQQLSFSLGILFAGQLLRLSAQWRQGSAAMLVTADFSRAFLVIGAIVPLALLFFVRLPANVGAALRRN
jgi:MFS family permease